MKLETRTSRIIAAELRKAGCPEFNSADELEAIMREQEFIPAFITHGRRHWYPIRLALGFPAISFPTTEVQDSDDFYDG